MKIFTRKPARRSLSHFIAMLLAAITLASAPMARSEVYYFVTSFGDSGAGSGGTGDLRYCITQANATPGADTIAWFSSGTITLTSRLPIITGPVTISTEGHSVTIDGANANRVFFVDALGVNVVLSGMTIANGRAVGGAGGAGGGGAGAGMGGGLFVNAGVVTLTGVTFVNCSAVGGRGGNAFNVNNVYYGSGGGGGGLHGAGGNGVNFGCSGGGGYGGNGGRCDVGGGGGGGLLGNGGNGFDSSGSAGGGGGGGLTAGQNAPGEVGGAGGTGGGHGGGLMVAAQAGALYGGGGGGGGTNLTLRNGGAGGKFGGGGGGIMRKLAAQSGGGAGGDFGGGGGFGISETGNAGLGGYGGGGGAGAPQTHNRQTTGEYGRGAAGGFGGGGGGDHQVVNAGGAFGGYAGHSGGAANGAGLGGGGGGAGLGGAIYVRGSTAGYITFTDGNISGSSVTGGLPGPQNSGYPGESLSQPGSTAGDGIFLDGTTATFTVTAGTRSLGEKITDYPSPAVPSNLVKAGAGTLILSGANSMLGNTVVEGGTLRSTHATALGTGRATVRPGATLELAANATASGLGDPFGTNGTSTGAVTSSTGAVLTLTPFVTFNLDSKGTLTGNVALTIAPGLAANAQYLSGSSTYTGATIVNGHLLLSHRSALGSTAGGTTVRAGGTLGLYQLEGTGSSITYDAEPLTLDTGSIFQLETGGLLRSATWTGPITLGAGVPVAVKIIGANAGTFTLGSLTGPGGIAFAAPSNSTIRLAGAADYTGPTTVAAGTNLLLAGVNALSVGAFDLAAGSSLNMGGFVAAVGSLSGAGAISGSAGSEFNIQNGGAVFTGSISGAVSLTLYAPGTQTLRGTNSYTGATSIFARKLVLDGDLTTATSGIFLSPNVLNATINFDATASNNVPIYSSSGFGAIGTAIIETTNPPGTVSLLTGAMTLYYPTTLRASFPNDHRVNFLGQISGNVGTLTIDGGGRVVLENPANNFNGNIVVSGAGTHFQVNCYSGEVIPDGSSVQVDGGTFFRLVGNANATETINALTGGGRVERHYQLSGRHTLLVGSAGGSGVFTGVLADGDLALNGLLALTKIGAGTQTLNGINTYTGPTAVNAGTLVINGSLASSATVNGGGTLAGTGMLQGGLAINTGGLTALSSGMITVAGAITNNGTIRLTGGAIFKANTATSFVNNGVIDLITGSAQLPPNFTNGASGKVLTAALLRVKNVAKNGSTVTLLIDGYTGHNFQLQRSSDLGVVAFTNVGAAQAGTSGSTLTFSDTSPTNTQSFYRFVVD